MTTRKKSSLIVIIFMLAIICPQICDADQSDQYNDIYTICMAENHKEGVQNKAGEWIIPPIYDGVSFDGYSYWVMFRIKKDEPPLIGVVNIREGFAIPAYYEDGMPLALTLSGVFYNEEDRSALSELLPQAARAKTMVMESKIARNFFMVNPSSF